MTVTQIAKVTIWQVTADGAVVGTFQKQADAIQKAMEIVNTSGSVTQVYGVTHEAMTFAR